MWTSFLSSISRKRSLFRFFFSHAHAAQAYEPLALNSHCALLLLYLLGHIRFIVEFAPPCTHTHTHTHTFSLAHTHTHLLSLSLAHTHSHFYLALGFFSHENNRECGFTKNATIYLYVWFFTGWVNKGFLQDTLELQALSEIEIDVVLGKDARLNILKLSVFCSLISANKWCHENIPVF